jgi:hypothetical protein
MADLRLKTPTKFRRYDMNTTISTATATSRARRRQMGAGLTALPLALLALANPAGASPSHTGGPSGNNGTVKIDGKAFDSHPNNEPHVGCTFEVDFYGFDKGDDLDAKVTFAVQPPTGKPAVLLTDTLPIGEDDNSGGGSEAGLDASREYDLSTYLVDVYPEHPQQGYHVKLTVNADGSRGADTKHKVFWVRDCTLPTTPPITTTDTPTDTPADNPEVSATVLGETLTKPDVTAPAATTPAVTVAGEQLAAPAPVGGVQTGGGGTSSGGGTNPLVPFGAAVAFLGLASYMAPRLRRAG